MPRPPASVVPPRRVAPRIACARAAAVLALAVATPALPAQDAPAPIVSMGQPPRWHPFVAGGAAIARDAAGAVAVAGVHRPIGSPVTGALGLQGELYARGDARPTAGLRLLAATRALNLAWGADHDARTRSTVFHLSWGAALRRGGLFGRGTMLRLDWTPARDRLDAVVTVPLAQPWAGRTRPRRTGIALRDVAAPGIARDPSLEAPGRDTARDGAIADALATAREAAAIVTGFTTLWSDALDGDGNGAALRAAVRDAREALARRATRFPDGTDPVALQRAHLDALARAFAIAAGDSATGAALANGARAGALATVLLPYDARFGQVKDDARDLGPLVAAARADFARRLADSLRVDAADRVRVLRVHEAWLAILAAQHGALVRQWHDTRRVWLPLQLALRPEEHDEQHELDALLERLTERRFADGTEATLLGPAELQLQLAQGILAARDHHVLWLHDFASRAPGGAFDRVAFAQVADVYLPALTRAVARVDSTGRLTTYLLYLDQNFYEPNGGRLWMTLLEDPLRARVTLPRMRDARERDSLAAVLAARQDALRAAVAASRTLQEWARARGGDAWLRRTVKVHVSITQPSDFTFRTHRLVPPLPFLPDNLARDHRKIAFWDLDPAAPARGALVVSGMGVGESYASPTWEDRGVLVRGAAALAVRGELVALLARNGIAGDAVPAPVRGAAACPLCAVDRSPPSSSSPVPGIGRVLQLHNQPGFGDKRSSIARALLYTLAPPGSVIVAPDALWLGTTWAGMLAGAALRGAQVHVVAPALVNAPSAGFPQMSRTRDVIGSLLRLRDAFAGELAASGGALRVGLYADTIDVNDHAAQAIAVRAGLARLDWLRTLAPLDTAALAALDSVPAALAAAGWRPRALGRDVVARPPQLHRKTQLVVDRATLARAMARPEWAPLVRWYWIERAAAARAIARPDSLPPAVAAAATRLMRGALRDLDRDGAAPYAWLTVGTHNQDDRGMLLDGEATVVLTGATALTGTIDLVALLARTTWLDDARALDAALPPYRRWQRAIGRMARLVL